MSDAQVVQLERDVLAPSTDQLRAVLSRALGRSRPGARVVDLERAPCPNSSSWWLEEITLGLSDGSRLALVFKDLTREAEGSAAHRVKPAFVTDPAREPWVYHNVLMDLAIGPPRLWAGVADAATGRHWLFIERANGVPLTQQDLGAWCAAAEWLGRFHATASVRRAVRGPLLHHTQDYHRRWLARALSVAQRDPQTGDAARERLTRIRALVPTHERALDQVLATGTSVIHGEFYASNVLIEHSDATLAVHPVDWEMAALGPPLLDLAALVSGRWSRGNRIAMATAYREGAQSAGVRCPSLDELLLNVTASRLLVAVQWLGWAAEWTAPADQRNDWLEEAELCARELRK